LQKSQFAMQTTGEIGTFGRRQAEVPHHQVAIALTGGHEEHLDRLEKLRPAPELPAPEPDDATEPLVERAKAGDRAALEELLAAIRPRCMAAALKILHNPDDAEDAVQTAFMKIWRCLGHFEGRSSFSTWTHRIVMNASLDLLRKGASRPETIDRPQGRDADLPEVEPSHEETPEAQLGTHQIQLMVRCAVAALPSAHRQAVELREFEDYSYQEVADSIHCPVGTVMSRLFHARHRLADQLREPLGEALQLFAA
jgi:RNA polymerase sigma-70 factor (ECF subfamily)